MANRIGLRYLHGRVVGFRIALCVEIAELIKKHYDFCDSQSQASDLKFQNKKGLNIPLFMKYNVPTIQTLRV